MTSHNTHQEDTIATGPTRSLDGIELNGVSKSFGAVTALDRVTLSVPPGRIHGLIGENGAGKSTLMAIASGALAPDAGRVLIGGVDVSGDALAARAAGLAIVRQRPAVLPELSVADNILLAVPADMRPKPSETAEWARRCIDAWDHRPDIDPSMRAGLLNAEQQFILELARALCQNPSVLLLDEPSEHLRAADVERLFDAVRRLAAHGTAVVYISHRIREVRAIAEQVTVLRNGVSRGTRVTGDLDEQQIVELIIGRSLDAQYPHKQPVPTRAGGHIPLLDVENATGEGFHHVSLVVRQGEVVGLAGIDDNGQAQLARALAGLQHRTGTVRLDGAEITSRGPAAAARAGIAYVPADRHREGVFPDLSVRENAIIRGIRKVARVGFVSPRRERSASLAVLRRYDVRTSSPDAPIDALSGGNQQKVVMGGALASDPRLLIADQPTQGVDVGAKSEIYSQLRSAASNGAGVLMLSSDNSELAGVCDRVVVMSRGQIVAEISGDAVTETAITSAVLRASSTREHDARPPRKWALRFDNDLAPVPVLIGLIAIVAVVAQISDGAYFGTRNISLVLGLAAILALAAAGQSIALMHGSVDLTIGPLMAFGPIIASFWIVGAGFAFDLWGWTLIVAVAVAVAVANWSLATFLRINPMLSGFAMWTLLDALALTLRPTAGGMISPATVSALSASLGPIPVSIVVAIVILAILEAWRRRTIIGKSVLAVGSSRSAAHNLGVKERRVTLVAHLATSLLACLAGILLIGQIGTGDPTAGTSYVLMSISAAVVGGVALSGGRGSLWGVFFAAILLVQVQTATPYLGLSAGWQNILLAAVTIAAVCAYSLARRRVH